eukprot:tig00020660_g12512.t1
MERRSRFGAASRERFLPAARAQPPRRVPEETDAGHVAPPAAPGREKGPQFVELPSPVPRRAFDEELADLADDNESISIVDELVQMQKKLWGVDLLISDIEFVLDRLVGFFENLQRREQVPRSAAGPGRYNIEAIDEFFARRPGRVARRAAELAVPALRLAAAVWLDKRRGTTSLHMQQRAVELRDMLANMGPAFIKVGQALSIRPDLVPPVVMAELQKLQDRLPSFPNEIAFAMIEEDLGRPWQEVFSELSPEPVAAASLGQVYRGRLLSGQEVAVKPRSPPFPPAHPPHQVQRPGVAASIALDLLILRRGAALLKRRRKLRSDLVGIVDEFGTRLYDELNYVAEGQNAARFAALYCPHFPDIRVPRIYFEHTTARVLVMEWITGTKLTDPVSTGDSDYLVELGVRCSLMQLLDCGFFHADPHPGNLLRTEDGKLAYLDFGMMSELEPRHRTALIKAVVHLVNREFAALASDFVALDFLSKAGSEKSFQSFVNRRAFEDVDLEPIKPALTHVFQNAVKDGVAELNFQNLSDDLAGVMYEFPFKIPPFYSLVIRSLTVLEGIALSSNPEFKVLARAYPYIVKQLMTANQEELKESLKELLLADGRIRWRRLESLVRKASEGAAPVARPAPGADPDAKRGETTAEIFEFVFSDGGTFIRDVVVDEVVRAVENAAEALAAEAAQTFWGVLQGRPPAPPGPGSMPWSRLRDEDREALESIGRLLQSASKAGQRVDVERLAAVVGPRLLPEGERLFGRLAERAAARALRQVMAALDPETFGRAPGPGPASASEAREAYREAERELDRRDAEAAARARQQ